MLSDNIRSLRKKNNMSQDELAEKLGVSRQSVSLWENGQTQPTVDNIIAMTKLFGVSFDMLLDGASDARSDEVALAVSASEAASTAACVSDTATEPAQTCNVADTDGQVAETADSVGADAPESTASSGIAARLLTLFREHKRESVIVLAAVLTLAVVLSVVLICQSLAKSGNGGDASVTESSAESAVESTAEADDTDSVTESSMSEQSTAAESESIADSESTQVKESTAEPITEETQGEYVEPVAPSVPDSPTTAAPVVTAAPTPAPTPVESQAPSAVEPFDLFEYCKSFAIKIGTLNGDYSIYQQPSTKYGGYENEYFSISYWADSDMVEFCLHCPLDDVLSINFYLRMRGSYDGKYEYLSSKYYRSSGSSLRSASGYIDPAVFSDSYPISCDSYIGDTSGQDSFMEESRVGICDLIRLIKQFAVTEGMECDFSAFGFVNF